MKQHQLVALVAVADHGGIHAAARALHLTQPAVTRALRDLETEVGTPLLQRQSRGVVLTAEGQVLLARARLIVRELQRAEEDMGQLRGRRGGRLVIGVTPLAGLTIVPKAFARFRQAWPEVALDFVECTPEQLHENLHNSRLDFAVGSTTAPQGDTTLRWEPLFSLPTAFGVRRDSPLAASRSLAELQGAEWIHTDVSGRFPALLAELFAREGLAPPARVTRCTSQALFHSLAMENDVVFFWSLFAIGMPELRQRFSALPLGLTLPRLSMSLLVHEDSLLTRAADYFIRCIREVAREEWTALD
ncbi:LysR family transcriptional regulator [Pelomonas aquatica]|uniref:LysR family transcriptional regulator n=1 Tax=Pelomonas aquatica TaxID=431058 RepID=A0A9X4R3A6_9BURK|nr:LysR substrate-binding domain-containing protein [Pelomonas aquatica]MCY4754819.1 LysR substrate-binding domain-containing protein [Pelomonas aquatica]MDG0861867.1 LysR family transcriptional regulator [Pelomonas aquatica]